jgi:hypothetical protein
MERRPIQVLDPHCRFTDIGTAAGAPFVGAVDRAASTQEGGLFRYPGVAFLQRCRCDNGRGATAFAAGLDAKPARFRRIEHHKSDSDATVAEIVIGGQ